MAQHSSPEREKTATSLDAYRVPPTGVKVESSRGRIVLWPVTADLVVQIGSGHGDATLAERFVATQNRLLEGRRDVNIFFDGLEFKGYDPEFRVPLTEFAQKQVARGQLKMLHMLTGSKLVAMGISVVNLAIGTKFEVYSRVATFHRKLVEYGGGAALDR